MRLSLLLLLLVVVSACSTLSKEELAAIRAKRVSPAVMAKLEQGDTLTPPEVIELSRRGVAQEQIARYIRRSGVDFLLAEDESLQMRRAGVSPLVIDAIARESAKFAADRAVMRGEAPPPGEYGPAFIAPAPVVVGPQFLY